MRAPPEELGDFRLADILSFLAVRRCGSITAAARELKVSPSQVSKSVARLEEQLHVTLLSRSARGVTLSDTAGLLVPHLEEVVARWRLLRRIRKDPLRELTIAAASYLNTLFLPRIAGRVPRLRLRCLEMPPPLVRALISQNFFDATLMLGEQSFSEVWIIDSVGEVRKGLFAAPGLAGRLGPQPLSVEQLREVPFVSPLYSYHGQFVPVDDGCPFHFGERRLGHEVQTIGMALEMASSTGQLVFGPVIAARGHLARGALVELQVQDWQISEPLYLACHGGRVQARDRRDVLEALRGALAELSAGP